jgi:hypothetical protein
VQTLKVQIQIQVLFNYQIKFKCHMYRIIKICIQVMPCKFIFMEIIPGENFGELFRFFPKGLMPIKIQTKFKSCLLSEFIIQKPFWNLNLSPKGKLFPFIYFVTPKRSVIFGAREGWICQFTKCAQEKRKWKSLNYWAGPPAGAQPALTPRARACLSETYCAHLRLPPCATCHRCSATAPCAPSCRA